MGVGLVSCDNLTNTASYLIAGKPGSYEGMTDTASPIAGKPGACDGTTNTA
jgi:hypothetical protein